MGLWCCVVWRASPVQVQGAQPLLVCAFWQQTFMCCEVFLPTLCLISRVQSTHFLKKSPRGSEPHKCNVLEVSALDINNHFLF